MMKIVSLSILLILQVAAAENFILPAPDPQAPVPWDMAVLYQPPQIFPASEFTAGEPGISALFYQGENFQGLETRIFSWIGIPTNGVGPFPGMVVVHGGGGTAYKEWVKLWMGRGYAVIAMDTDGHIPIRPEGATKGWVAHEYHGPSGGGGFRYIDDDVADQWSYHAVAAVIRGHSLLRSLPQVDASRIGMTGISWGGYLTCIAAGLDDRLSFAAPVYGCGFLGEDSSWLYTHLQPMGAEKALKWLTLWDPSRYVNRSEIPMLFVNGTNDKHYRMGSWQKTYRQPQGIVISCCKVRMAHDHATGWGAEEVYTFADSILKNGAALPRIEDQGRAGRDVWVKFKSSTPIQKAELNYTTDTGEWPDRKWVIEELPFDPSSGRAVGCLNENATAYFINLIDSRGCLISSQHETGLILKN